jgi:hypothetical protein
MAFSVVILIVGAVFLIVGLIGGGIKIGVKEGEASIPPLNPIIRLVIIIIGAGFIIFSLWRELNPSSSVTPQVTNTLESPTTPTETFIAEASPSPTNTAQVVASPTLVILSPLPSEYISIKGFSGVVNSGGIPGDTIYSHLITGKIQYTRVEADDDVQKMELVCKGNQVQDISSSFFLIPQPPSSVFPNYASNIIDVPSDCRIDFYVRDTLGVQSGITIQSVPIQ